MSLAAKFKTDTTAARDGVWFEYKDQPNADGSIPAFKLARMSKHNKKYSASVRKHTEKYSVTVKEGVADFDGMTEEDGDAMVLNAFVETVLLDWRNFQPEDDGKALEYSKDNAMFIMSSEDWLDLYADLTLKAAKSANYRHKVTEAQAKNS